MDTALKSAAYRSRNDGHQYGKVSEMLTSTSRVSDVSFHKSTAERRPLAGHRPDKYTTFDTQ